MDYPVHSVCRRFDTVREIQRGIGNNDQRDSQIRQRNRSRAYPKIDLEGPAGSWKFCTDGSYNKQGSKVGIAIVETDSGKEWGGKGKNHSSSYGAELEAIEKTVSIHVKKGTNIIFSDCLSAINVSNHKENSEDHC